MALQASSLLPSTFSKGKASATLKNSSIFGASLSDYTKSDFGSSSFRVKNQRRSSNGGVVRATMVASPGVTTNSPSGKKTLRKGCVIVTGASSGLGLATAKALSETGKWHVIMACRDFLKAEKAAKSVGMSKENYTIMHLDLASLDSVRQFVDNFRRSGRPLDVLVANAAVYQPTAKEPSFTAEGFELSVGTNHLGHFLLSRLLLDDLKQSDYPSKRLIIVGSITGNTNTLAGNVPPKANLGDLRGMAGGLNGINSSAMIDGGEFDGAKAYKDSKVCNMLTMQEFHRRYHEETGITFASLYPGCIATTGLFREHIPLFRLLFPPFQKYITKGYVSETESGKRLAQVVSDPSLTKSGVYWSWNKDSASFENQLSEEASAFSTSRLKATLHNLIPSFMASISSNNHDFKGFSDIDSLYSKGLLLKLGLQDEVLKKLPLPKVVSTIKEGDLLKYDTPKILSKDKFAWLRDDEFARQAIAGVNPVSIEKLQVFPPVSKLDPEIYGPQESALKEEHILGHLNGMTVQEALDANKLFILDHHDVYLPFLDRINALDGRKAYATRTIYFLSDVGTLKPIAIELSLPQTGPSSRSKRVVTPPVCATGNWMWQIAKAHVCANDAGVHQLVNHWLRTHASLEPFILAAHRQLSAMHPIYKLLDPHMRYTLEINGLARQSLINADGVIEACFTPGRYCMEISAAAYKNWRFDLEGLPADLIRRGMAVPDATQPYGLKLLIEDYPYAADGLMIWGAIEGWVRDYVDHYYPSSAQVCSDRELQAWYTETINVGHVDLRNEDWWPTLATPEDLISILTTLIWLASAQHAALNFGQYPYSGYVPNRPPLMRRLIPDENDPEYAVFLADPQKYFFSALPSLLQATKFMAVVDTLSTHSPDEEYIGERQQPSTWTGDAEIVEAFYKFSAEIGRIEKEIDERNADTNLKNRCGAGVLPYELLAPSSGPGVTCRGVPNSVSI